MAPHLPRRPARGDHHVIGHRRTLAQIDLHDVFGLVVFERVQDQFQNCGTRKTGRGVLSGGRDGGRIDVRQVPVLLHGHCP